MDKSSATNSERRCMYASGLYVRVLGHLLRQIRLLGSGSSSRAHTGSILEYSALYTGPWPVISR